MSNVKQNLLKDKNFRLLFWGETVSNLGDQFTFIALPWLVLKLTGDPVVLGVALGLAGIPRALFMLIGGALVDRFSPRTVMLLSNLVRLINVTVLALLVLTGSIEIWMVYAYALVFGTADAFFMPSQASLVTRLSSRENLEQANTYIMGSAQLSQFIGPALVGVLIGVLDKGSQDMTGIGLAMVFDALTFVVSLLTLAAIRTPESPGNGHKENVMASIVAGLKYSWSNAGLRYILLLAAAINFLLVGPIIIGIPVIAETRLPQGAAAYGIIMSAFGIGTLVGIVLVGILARKSPFFRKISLLLGLTAAIGILLALLAVARSTPVYAGLTFAMALFSGYVSISFITLIQRQVPPEMMGRLMSIISLFSIGLVPVSEIVAGVVVKMGVDRMFAVAGVLFFAISASMTLVPAIKKFEGLVPPSPPIVEIAAAPSSEE